MSLQTRDTLTLKNGETLELFVDDAPVARGDAHKGMIEWIIPTPNDPEVDEDVEHIGLWWRAGELFDYDGISDWLPAAAITLLQRNRISVPRDMRE